MAYAEAEKAPATREANASDWREADPVLLPQAREARGVTEP
jgi:hypothetical protein